MPYNANKHEQDILELWKKDRTFERSIEERPADKPYVFYDGPPFATGLPHYGHILSSVIKDVVPRYWTMKGYRVRRRWGWDCHGLPIEQLIEKEMEISGKKQIEDEIGVEAFNNACRSKVLMYTKEWKKMVDRIGRWIEFDTAYKTMDASYIESVWWGLKKLWDGGKIYEGRKVLMYCPRCETPVSKAEVAMDHSYKDITEESVTVKFRVVRGTSLVPELKNIDGPLFILAWTTTPWTLPGNMALAVGEKMIYSVVRQNGEYYVLADDLVSKVMRGEYEVVTAVAGHMLVGLEYEPLFALGGVQETGKKAYYITIADFVTTDEGTGVVHTAVMYGEDDYNLGVQRDLPIIPMLDDRGHYNDAAPAELRGEYFKKGEKWIKLSLEERGLLFSRMQNTHSYPHCWRCDTQLIYNAVSAWFINIQGVKEKMIKLNQKINWFPQHLKDGRFLNILETAPDWNISRNRYWASPLPFWRCATEKCSDVCIGSIAELKTRAVNFDDVYPSDDINEINLHKHTADKIILRCESCGGEMHRTPEVIDCWFEAASMPYAELHYPFENQELFEKRFPGQYIAEYIAQTRAWFYYMHAVSTLLFDNVSFENVVCTGTILNEKGEKLSKSKRNFTDPWVIIEQYGMDALRYYLMSSVVMQAENMNFSDREMRDVYNKVLNTIWNVREFYVMFTKDSSVNIQTPTSTHVLDRWILAKLEELVKATTEHMDGYDVVRASRGLGEFITELSTWYLRRSRDRFKSDDAADAAQAVQTLGYVLDVLSRLMAPIMPFMAEQLYQAVHGENGSVHLQSWPVFEPSLFDPNILGEMGRARTIVELGLAARDEAKIRVRQPLQHMYYQAEKLSPALEAIIADELNVKEVMHTETVREQDDSVVKEEAGVRVGLKTTISEELKKEGLVRELVRAINSERKQLAFTPTDVMVLTYETEDAEMRSVFEEFADVIAKEVHAARIQAGAVSEKEGGEDTAVRLKLEKQ